jgi:hypothetical protein
MNVSSALKVNEPQVIITKRSSAKLILVDEAAGNWGAKTLTTNKNTQLCIVY